MIRKFGWIFLSVLLVCLELSAQKINMQTQISNTGSGDSIPVSLSGKLFPYTLTGCTFDDVGHTITCTGSVSGPVSSIVNDVPTFSDTTGKNLQDSLLSVSNSGSTITGGANLFLMLSGNSTGSTSMKFNATANLTRTNEQSFLTIFPTFAPTTISSFQETLQLNPTFNDAAFSLTPKQISLYFNPTLTSVTEYLDIFEPSSLAVNLLTGVTQDQHRNELGTETLAAGSAVSITNASTLHVVGPPAAGTNVTITNPYSILVDNGIIQAPTINATTALKVNGVSLSSPATNGVPIFSQCSGTIGASNGTSYNIFPSMSTAITGNQAVGCNTTATPIGNIMGIACTVINMYVHVGTACTTGLHVILQKNESTPGSQNEVDLTTGQDGNNTGSPGNTSFLASDRWNIIAIPQQATETCKDVRATFICK